MVKISHVLAGLTVVVLGVCAALPFQRSETSPRAASSRRPSGGQLRLRAADVPEAAIGAGLATTRETRSEEREEPEGSFPQSLRLTRAADLPELAESFEAADELIEPPETAVRFPFGPSANESMGRNVPQSAWRDRSADLAVPSSTAPRAHASAGSPSFAVKPRPSESRVPSPAPAAVRSDGNARLGNPVFSAGAEGSRASSPPPQVPLENVAPSRTAAATPEERNVAARKHRIRDGDTLRELARRYLGDADRARELFEANRHVLKQPDLLPIGVTLVIPPAAR